MLPMEDMTNIFLAVIFFVTCFIVEGILLYAVY